MPGSITGLGAGTGMTARVTRNRHSLTIAKWPFSTDTVEKLDFLL
jgi:hypothetical protein